MRDLERVATTGTTMTKCLAIAYAQLSTYRTATASMYDTEDLPSQITLFNSFGLALYVQSYWDESVCSKISVQNGK